MASPVIRLDQARDARTKDADAIRAWIEQIIVRGDGAGPYSIERLAKKAGTSATNISRFLKDGYPVPKMDTLSKIGRAAGVPPPSATLTVSAIAFVDIPVIVGTVAKLRGIQAAMSSAASTTRAPARYQGCFAVRITADTASLAGVLVGDLVVADPDATPETNDLVVVCLDTGEVGVYRVIGPHLMPQAPANLPALSISGTTVLGVARQVQRELR